MTRVTSTYITAVIHTNYEQQKKRETKSPFIAPA